MSFRENIKAARTAAGLTQAAAATLLKIERRSLQHWEDGKRVPIWPAQLGALTILKGVKPLKK